MIRHILFDAYASREEIADEADQIRHWPGVRSLRLLELAAMSGREAAAPAPPHYCLQLETDDDRDAAIMARMESLIEQYREHLHTVETRVYQPVG